MKVLGINGGNGVILYPFKKYLIGNIEPRSDFFMGNYKDQWRLNFGNIPIRRTDHFFRGEQVDVIVGHPDCGHSSNLAYSRGKKLGDGKNNESMQLYINCVNAFKPKLFLFENLPTLFKSFPEAEFDEAFPDHTLHKINGTVALYGNSQISRHRLVIIGIRKGIKSITASDFKLPKSENINLKTSKALLADLNYPDESLCHIRESLDTVVCMEKDFKKLNLKEIKEIWNSPAYKNRKKWDATTTGKGRMKNLPGVYRNLADEYPLTARKQNRQFNHLGDIMSPRELARIQGIPDDFKLYYDPNKSQYTINKARITATKTPPYEIGLWFYKRLRKLHLHHKI